MNGLGNVGGSATAGAAYPMVTITAAMSSVAFMGDRESRRRSNGMQFTEVMRIRYFLTQSSGL
jgi:hypothetical protein